MSSLSRRHFLTSTAVAGGAVALPALAASPASADPAADGDVGALSVVTRDDPRYAGLLTGSNQRWVASPERIHLVRTADDVVRAVRDAVHAGRRVAVRSGGHCDEDFSSNGAPVLIDLSLMDEVGYDPHRRAFAVQPGATLGAVYHKLYRGWGVTLPGGTCPTVGAGGHIVGGGYGALSRLHGLTVDHLHAVEVVVVGADREARKVVATSDPGDPHRELWWAHTGGGGGTFGVVTRYWLRTPGTADLPPERQLPRPPANLLVSDVSWSWADLDERSFTRILRNYTEFFERNSAPGSPWAALFSQLKPTHKAAGAFTMSTQVDASAPDAHGLLDAFLAAVGDGTGVRYRVNDRSTVPWTYAAKEWFGFVTAAVPRWKAKSAYLRKAPPEPQLKAFHRHLTRDDYGNPSATVVLAAYGGRINAVGRGETATAQRDSVLKLLYLSLWTDRAADAEHIRWVREFYADVYAETGGVPAPGDVTDGCYINYPDVDMADPAINTSGVPWHALYFKDGYPRLRRVKAAYDPLGVFSHALAVRAD
ncbi:FAD-binding oxidoreductase [Saccharothrix australiensis]|uniref:FAD/FMN-containing dehydrogenase n=1 Tax=Saccharothrix australiensis TaxID=2072 RepID=A0A495W1D2_9PSEU|nr:FAD-binding protein [Saccharothrix australiensis]RKT54543.1 FAD/FMN-containing dehydrogenase [Saccharothrix australiensis]